MTKKQPQKVLYVREGHFISGVPTRDMLVSEFENLKPELQEKALQSGVYVYENNSKGEAEASQEDD